MYETLRCSWLLFIYLITVINPTGYHTYASARGHETYEFLRDCFAPVWDEVAELIANPVIRVNEGDYTLEVVCGSDYKVHVYVHMYMYMYIHIIYAHAYSA